MIVRVEEADAVDSAIKNMPGSLPSILRIEGFMSVGKTPFAHALGKKLGRCVISSDSFVDQTTSNDRPYKDCLRLSELHTNVRNILKTNSLVFEGICSQEALATSLFGRGYVIYLKRLSFNNPDEPMWHDGYKLEEPERANKLHRSIHRYHLEFEPHRNADLVLELPNSGHSLIGPRLS